MFALAFIFSRVLQGLALPHQKCYRRTDRQAWEVISNRIGVADGGTDQHGRAAGDQIGGGRTLPGSRTGGEGSDSRQLYKVTGWHRKNAVRALAERPAAEPDAARQRTSTYDVVVKDALTALWEASDRICGKRLKVMIPTLLPALERHGRLKLGAADRVLVLAISAATIDRLLADTKIAAAGGKRRRVGFYSAIRREVPIRTFNDWQDPPPGFCEIDMVAHGGTSVAGSFIQTLTMVDVATGWTECLPSVTREGSLVVEAIKRARACSRGSISAPTSTMTARS